MSILSRRTFLEAAGTSSLLAAGPSLALAAVPTDRRLVVILLRGGLDGLAALPPVADPHYAVTRGDLALPVSGEGAVLPLDGFFALHPNLETLHGFWRNGELLPVHAIASPYRERSHFDAQNVVETGAKSAREKKDGWLNRALQGFGPLPGGYALAFSEAMPMLLSGTAPVTSYAPPALPQADDDFLARVGGLYETDPLLADALARAIETRAMAEEAMEGAGRPGHNQIVNLAGPAGRFLTQSEGARVAVLDPGGWDTHARQGAVKGALSNKLRQLDRGIRTLKAELGPAWAKTAVLVVTEFGRTVAMNGTGGTDHGTAGAAFALGGAVRGGRVETDWPGLAATDLRDGRDLRPTLDLRALFKAALVDHMGLRSRFVDANVFPGSGAIRPLAGVFRG